MRDIGLRKRVLASADLEGESNVKAIPEAERKVYKTSKETSSQKPKTKSATEPATESKPKGASSTSKTDQPKKEFRGLGSLEITNANGMKLSPAKVLPYSLYKLAVKKPFEIITVCYESYIEDDTLVRLNYRSRHKTFSELPSKDDSDQVLQKLGTVENTLEEFLKSYEELQRFEERFVSTSNDTLSSFMTFGQILLFAYLVVVWLLKLLIEKTFRYKKLI